MRYEPNEVMRALTRRMGWRRLSRTCANACGYWREDDVLWRHFGFREARGREPAEARTRREICVTNATGGACDAGAD